MVNHTGDHEPGQKPGSVLRWTLFVLAALLGAALVFVAANWRK